MNNSDFYPQAPKPQPRATFPLHRDFCRCHRCK